ncbi:hypothetical protein K456DRAFT_1134452 [Colletotrichum gloeosporioides 23]|nr:hypothetical protein K456DRAFT_1134452 [Colletotrichum gloeosporioides 23]
MQLNSINTAKPPGRRLPRTLLCSSVRLAREGPNNWIAAAHRKGQSLQSQDANSSSCCTHHLHVLCLSLCVLGSSLRFSPSSAILASQTSRAGSSTPDQSSPVQSSPLLSSHIHPYQQTRMPLAAALMQVKSAVIFMFPKSTGGVQRPGQHSRALQPCRPSRPIPYPHDTDCSELPERPKAALHVMPERPVLIFCPECSLPSAGLHCIASLPPSRSCPFLASAHRLWWPIAPKTTLPCHAQCMHQSNNP